MLLREVSRCLGEGWCVFLTWSCTGVIEAKKSEYKFYIDRLDSLRNVVYAHYSFQVRFYENGDYSVYMDGCCRPATAEDQNNYGLPFHLRAGIQLYAAGQPKGAARPYPMTSIQVNMPDLVMLRAKGYAYDACKEFTCERSGTVLKCFSRFLVQAYHPIEEYRSKVRVRVANAGERGWWRCGGGIEGEGIPEWGQVLCAGELLGESDKSRFNDPLSYATHTLPDGASIEVRPEGDGFYLVKFMVSQTDQNSRILGFHSLSLTIDCEGCVNGDTQSVPLDITVQVKQTDSNGDAPAMTTLDNPNVDNSGVENAVPASCPQSPVQIYCGRERFELGDYSQNYLRLAFKDPDDQVGFDNCDLANPETIPKQLPQQLKVIHEASTLPVGITYVQPRIVAGASLQTGDTNYLNPEGAGYIDIRWRPACENPSQLGLRQLCFTARDSFFDSSLTEVPTFPFLYSPPSMLDPSVTEAERDVSNPNCPKPLGLKASCIFVNVGAPRANVDPAYVLPTAVKGRECSAGCCECCGQEFCDCPPEQLCCAIMYTTTGKVFKHVVRAIDGPISASAATSDGYFPERDDHDSYAVFINFTFPDDVKPAPTVRPMKYGCGSTPYDQCVSNPSRKADAMTELVWDLTGMGYSCLKPGANTTTKCEGTEDVTTCAGGTECEKDEVPLPFKVCYRAQEQKAPWVDEVLWRRTYGESSVREACDVCFKLAIADRPIFLEDDNVSPLQGAVFEVPAGREFTFPLTAAAANDATGVVVISILSDPGAPLGAKLGPPAKVLCDQVAAVCELFHKSGYQRYFSYTPQVEHGGQKFELCFTASMQDVKAGASLASQVSEPRCISIKVLMAEVDWSGTSPCEVRDGAGTCLPQGHIRTTVGCNVAYNLNAKARLYDLSIEHKTLPTCSNCVGGGLAVRACSETGNVWPCCGNGFCDGAEMGSNCPQDCEADNSTLQLLRVGSASNDYVSLAEFRWTPTRGMEGRRLLSCFQARDALLDTGIIHPARTSSSAPSYCVVVDVDRCAYCVPDGSSMMYIARHYMLNVDWLRLYNANPRVEDPDGVFPYDKLIVGPTYTVHPGDTLLTIAGSKPPHSLLPLCYVWVSAGVVIAHALAETDIPLRSAVPFLFMCSVYSASAKTTLKAIVENNPDILDDSDLREGQQICLLLCSASPTTA